MIVGRIVVIVAGAEQSDQKVAVHAFIVVQRLYCKKQQAQQSRRKQNGQAAPPPEIARCADLLGHTRGQAHFYLRLALDRICGNRFHPYGILNQELRTSSACLSRRLAATSIYSWLT